MNKQKQKNYCYETCIKTQDIQKGLNKKGTEKKLINS